MEEELPGELKPVLDTVCELVGHFEGAQIVCILRAGCKSGGAILGSWGCNARSLTGNVRFPELDAIRHPLLIVNNLDRAKWYQSHPLRSIAPFAKRLVAVSLPDLPSDQQCFIALLFGQTSAKSKEPNIPYLSNVARLSSLILRQGPRPGIQGGLMESGSRVGQAVPPVGEEAVLAFLSNTLIKKTTLRSRGGVPFIVARQWRAALKDVQIAALEGLKIEPSKVAVDLIARELSLIIASVYQGVTFDAIVPVPCGSSGRKNCMSVAIAAALSERLNIPMMNCLNGEQHVGRSHPHKSKTLKPYTLHGEVSGQLLLVDDVITSGKHLLMAWEALRTGGASVNALVWLGS